MVLCGGVSVDGAGRVLEVTEVVVVGCCTNLREVAKSSKFTTNPSFLLRFCFLCALLIHSVNTSK